MRTNITVDGKIIIFILVNNKGVEKICAFDGLYMQMSLFGSKGYQNGRKKDRNRIFL